MPVDPEITMKNTKAEILDALNAALSKNQVAEQNKLNPEKIEKEKAVKKSVESAKEAVGQNIFSEALNNKFKDLQAAISFEESRLEELYGISKELQKLAVIIEAGRERQAVINLENEEKIEAAKGHLEQLRSEYSQKKTELQEEYDVMSKKLKTDRARELEEFLYSQKRERELENNAWADEKTARETELRKREELISQNLSEIEEKSQYIKNLETKVETFPSLVENEKKAAVENAILETAKDYEHKSALANLEYQNNLARKDDKIEYFAKELDALSKTNASLQNKLDKAYTELRELATKTVESASGVKIIGGNTE